MSLFKCKMCGGSLEINNGATIAECEYCGTKQTLPKTNDDVISNLFNRANNLRMKCEFDKAAQIYEKIVQQDDSEAEAHWGIVLCKYGIEYVEDPKTFKRIPTCHRTLFEAVTTDADYLAAIDYSDAAQQHIYESEARAIDRIQKDILVIAKNEKPFDVFICYKETDENGKRTIDSTIANDIYYQLTQEGFKVFFAAITLEDKLGQEYEPYIFAALNSAKVMLVLGTKPEHYSAVWVKNEWSRFLQLMKTDRSKLLIPCYRDMDAYDLPEEFAHLQAQDMGKIGFINDVVRGIKKIIAADEPKTTVAKETVIATANANTVPLLKRAFMFLEDGDWNSANEYCEKVLDVEPENAQAYLGKLMAELHVRKQESLKDQSEPFDYSNNYQKTVRFAADDLKTALAGYIDHINTRNENARLDGVYNEAKGIMLSADTEIAYKKAALLFESIDMYLDSSILAQECYDHAENIRKDLILLKGNAKMQGSLISTYEAAIKLFETIPGWKDADEKLYICKNIIDEAQKEAERISKRNKKIAIITAPIVCAIIAFIIVLNAVVIPNIKYNAAIALMNDGNVVDAYEALIALDGYKDSEEKANLIYVNYKFVKLKAAKPGDYVSFGVYEQDNNTSNGKENIEWLVLEVKNNKALVISKYALDCKQYNMGSPETTWETCTLRKWLNGDFVNAAFSDDEKTKISTVTVSADKNSDYSTNPGNKTKDQVFLLSINEVNNYFDSDVAMQCKPTDYAIARGAYANSYNGNCWWWLRSPGSDQNKVTNINFYGEVIKHGNAAGIDTYAVRPTMWIDLSNC